MKKTLALVVAIATVSAGQSDGASIAGSWTARFEGRTFLRLELKTENGTITGAMSMGSFEVDSQGAVSRADESPRALTPIFDVKRSASVLTFFPERTALASIGSRCGCWAPVTPNSSSHWTPRSCGGRHSNTEADSPREAVVRLVEGCGHCGEPTAG